MRRERRSTKTIKMDFVRNAGEMAETKTRDNASKFFKHKAYACDGKELNKNGNT